MSTIEANIIIEVPDYVDISSIINEIQSVISEINNKHTHINVIEIDNPLTLGNGELNL